MLIVSAIEVLDLHIGGFSHVLGQIGTECDACVVSAIEVLDLWVY